MFTFPPVSFYLFIPANFSIFYGIDLCGICIAPSSYFLRDNTSVLAPASISFFTAYSFSADITACNVCLFRVNFIDIFT